MTRSPSTSGPRLGGIVLGGIVLCGGRSSRMGMPKALLPVGAETMLERVIGRLRPVVGPLVVVAAPDQPLPVLPSGVELTRDERAGRGPLEGLRAGLTHLAGAADAAYATSCDVPLLEAAFVQRLAEQLGDYDVVVPVEAQFHHPLAAIYRTTVLPVVQALLAEDRLRPVYLFERVRTLRVPVDELRAVDPQLRTLENVNHPEDYLRLLAAERLAAPPDVLRQLK